MKKSEGTFLFLRLLIVQVTLSLASDPDCPHPPLISRLESNNNTSNGTLGGSIFRCNASYPIQWTFDAFPGITVTVISSNICEKWSVNYHRASYDGLESPDQNYSSTLTFANAPLAVIAFFNPSCMSIGNICNSTSLSTLALNVGNDKMDLSLISGLKLDASAISKCSISLWTDASPGMFYCSVSPSSNANSSLGLDPNVTASVSNLSVNYCSNPTECNLHFQDDCPDKSSKTRRCLNDRDCQKLRIGQSAPLPRLISCSNSQTGLVRTLPLLGNPVLSIREVKGQHASYQQQVDNPDGLIWLKLSNKPLANISFDLSCSASAFYFASGLHLTLKEVSQTSFIQQGFTKLAGIKLRETVEKYRDPSAKDEWPIRRVLLAQGVRLPAGEYELSCHAPHWNSTQWTIRSILVNIADAVAPTFITGNRTRELQFSPGKNITCLAKGSPLPSLSWSYDPDFVNGQLPETDGTQGPFIWTIITLPASFEGTRLELRCHAENEAGSTEKMFVISKNDESVMLTTKMAAGIIVIGFVANLIVGYFCWKYLFSEEEATVVKYFHSIRRKVKTSRQKKNINNGSDELPTTDI